MTEIFLFQVGCRIIKLCIKVDEYKETIDKISNKLRSITNRFSVCVCKKDEFLFLGDLEKDEVKLCLEQMKRDNQGEKIKVKNLITPHHGSRNHYINNFDDYVEAEFAISSNGARMFEQFELDYNKCAKNVWCTQRDGDYIDNEAMPSRITY